MHSDQTLEPTLNPTSPPTANPTTEPFTGPYLYTEDGFLLIERHKNVLNGYFSSDVHTTGIENENDTDANKYSIIGAINSSDYLFDAGYYHLKLQYFYEDGTNDTLEWTQTSWITESTITGANLSFGVEDSYSGNTEVGFYGLGLSTSNTDSKAYLDGNGAAYTNWWHSIATDGAYCGGGICGIPAHEGTFIFKCLSLWFHFAILSICIYLMYS